MTHKLWFLLAVMVNRLLMGVCTAEIRIFANFLKLVQVIHALERSHMSAYNLLLMLNCSDTYWLERLQHADYRPSFSKASTHSAAQTALQELAFDMFASGDVSATSLDCHEFCTPILNFPFVLPSGLGSLSKTIECAATELEMNVFRWMKWILFLSRSWLHCSIHFLTHSSRCEWSASLKCSLSASP